MLKQRTRNVLQEHTGPTLKGLRHSAQAEQRLCYAGPHRTTLRTLAYACASLTLDMNFLQTARISGESVAENIITCLSWGVCLKISWMSARISA